MNLIYSRQQVFYYGCFDIFLRNIYIIFLCVIIIILINHLNNTFNTGACTIKVVTAVINYVT
jgi:hypothetical protein